MISLADHEQHTSECPRHDPATCPTCSSAIEPLLTTTCQECGVVYLTTCELHRNTCSHYVGSTTPAAEEPQQNMAAFTRLPLGLYPPWDDNMFRQLHAELEEEWRDRNQKAFANLTNVRLDDPEITSEIIRTVLSNLGQFTAAEIEGIVERFHQISSAPPAA